MRWLEWGQWPYANFKIAHFIKYLGSMLTDFHDTSITGLLLMRQLKWGHQPYANFKTAHFDKYLGFHVDRFWWHFYNRGFFQWDDWNEGNSPILTSKLHILINISDPCWWIFTRLLWQGFFWWDDWNKGNSPMLTSKLHILIKYLRSMLMDFHMKLL